MNEERNLEQKVQSALRWMETKLRHDGGPRQGRPALLLLRVDDVPNEPGQGMTNVFCLPDLDPGHLIEGLEKFIADLKAGSVDRSPIIEIEAASEPEPPTTVQ
jgi:hypothetical protein